MGAKRYALWLLRLAAIAAPAYSLYIFATGEGAGRPLSWWESQAFYILWALGSYFIILISSYAIRINWVQILVLALGVAGLAYFYLVPDIYALFLESPFFAENKKALPVVPYLYTVIICFVAMLLKSPAKMKRG